MEHSGWIFFTPLFKSVHFNLSVMHRAVEVHRLPGVVPDTIPIQPMVLGYTVVQVEPFNLVYHVALVVARQGTIVCKPSQLVIVASNQVIVASNQVIVIVPDSRELQGYLKEVQRVFQGSFKGVSRQF